MEEGRGPLPGEQEGAGHAAAATSGHRSSPFLLDATPTLQMVPHGEPPAPSSSTPLTAATCPLKLLMALCPFSMSTVTTWLKPPSPSSIWTPRDFAGLLPALPRAERTFLQLKPIGIFSRMSGGVQIFNPACDMSPVPVCDSIFLPQWPLSSSVSHTHPCIRPESGCSPCPEWELHKGMKH